jgi:hypothetical protein
MTDERVGKFLSLVRQGGSITSAAVQSGIARRTVYEWKANDSEFADALEDAYQQGIAVLEEEAVRRAYHGNDRPVFQKGIQVGTVKEFSDSLLMFLLKARDPRFRDKATVEMTGAVKTETADLTKLSTEELRSLYEIAARTGIKAA